MFDGNLKSSVSGAPRLRNVGIGNVFHRDRVPGEGRTKVLKFPNGSGLKVHTKGLIPSSHYSVVMQFRLATAGTDVYARILNPTLPADDNDNGLYLYNNYLDWYDVTGFEGTEGTVTPEKYVEVAFTRNTDGKIRVYANGAAGHQARRRRRAGGHPEPPPPLLRRQLQRRDVQGRRLPDPALQRRPDREEGQADLPARPLTDPSIISWFMSDGMGTSLRMGLGPAGPQWMIGNRGSGCWSRPAAARTHGRSSWRSSGRPESLNRSIRSSNRWAV